MPKVLRIINRFNLGGPTYNAAYLTKYLSPDYETLLVGGEKDESEDSSRFIVDSLGLHPLIIPEMRRSINPANDGIAYNKIKNIIKRYKPDIVHTHASKAGTLGRIAAFSCNVPVVVHTFHGHVFHSYFSKASTTFYKTVERRLAKKSTKIIALSELQKFELTEIHQICEPAKIEIIPLGFDLNRFHENTDVKRIVFRKEFLLDEDEIAIGIVGRLVPIKNHPLFLQAIHEILEKTTQKVRFFIVGDGESRQDLFDFARALNIDHIYWPIEKRKSILTFTSWIKDIDIVNSGLDIIALTSLNEGTPVSLIEAQASNKPIVTTDVGGIGNVVEPNKTALLSPSDDYMAFADNLFKVIENKDLRLAMSENGWLFVKEKFHYQRLANDMKALYCKLLS